MNWYKKALEKQDFYNFYALSSLSDEELASFPVFFQQLIDVLKSLRNEYFNFFVDDIAEELEHALDLNWKLPGIFNIESLSPDVLSYFKFKNEQDEFYYSKFGNVALENLVLRQEVRDEIINVVQNLENKNNLKENLEAAIFWFKKLPWGFYFGGSNWVLITEKVLALYKLPELKSLEEDEDKWRVIRHNLSFLRELVVLIDTLNSIAHNSNIALSDIGKIRGWFLFALEAKKHAKHPASLALLAKNYGLLKYYHKDVFPLHPNEKEEYREDQRNLTQQTVESIIRDVISPRSQNKINLSYFTKKVIPGIKDKNLLESIYNMVEYIFLNESDKYVSLYIESENIFHTGRDVYGLFTNKLIEILDGIVYNPKISPKEEIVKKTNNLKNKIYESKRKIYESEG